MTGVQCPPVHSASLSTWIVIHCPVKCQWLPAAEKHWMAWGYQGITTLLPSRASGRLVTSLVQFLIDSAWCYSWASSVFFYLSFTSKSFDPLLWFPHVLFFCMLQPGLTWPFFAAISFLCSLFRFEKCCSDCYACSRMYVDFFSFFLWSFCFFVFSLRMILLFSTVEWSAIGQIAVFPYLLDVIQLRWLLMPSLPPSCNLCLFPKPAFKGM